MRAMLVLDAKPREIRYLNLFRLLEIRRTGEDDDTRRNSGEPRRINRNRNTLRALNPLRR